METNRVRGEITVRHGEVAGLMPAMTMQYRVKNSAEMRDLQNGDRITAVLAVSKRDSQSWLEDVHVTAHSDVDARDAQAPNRTLVLGESVPDIQLVNQDGKTIRLNDFSGKALLITFIYTRCPMPEYCPRLSSQFARIHDALKKKPNDYAKTHLLTISFDPDYDTPEVLHRYGLAYLDGDEAGFSHWDFASVGGSDLERLAKAFGLQYEHQDNQIVHTMNIILVAPNSTIRQYWSTDWTWSELMESMENSVRGSNMQSREVLGQGLYNLLCARCHETSNPDLRKQPPILHGLFRTSKLPSGASATDEQIRHTIVQGLRTMPAFDQTISDEDVNAILAYLHKLN